MFRRPSSVLDVTRGIPRGTNRYVVADKPDGVQAALNEEDQNVNAEPSVWIRKRATKRGTSYHLRWICPQERRWRNRRVGTDIRRARHEAAKLEAELTEGTYRAIRRTAWDHFVDEHVGSLRGARNATEARRTLDEFHRWRPLELHEVTYQTIEQYVAWLYTNDDDENGKIANSVATVNKKCRYLKAAFNKAIRRGYLARNPMDGWRMEREDDKPPRIVTLEEEKALTETAKQLYGLRMSAFVITALNTGARRGELVGLEWNGVDLDVKRIHLAHTKGKRDRLIPLPGHVVDTLRRLQVQTLKEGGPFKSLRDNLGRRWRRVCKQARVAGVSIHDLRRTYCTRLIRAGVPLPTVQRLAGHRDIKTTMRYYTWVNDDDLRQGVAKLTEYVESCHRSATKRRKGAKNAV